MKEMMVLKNEGNIALCMYRVDKLGPKVFEK